ncbi:MAG: baseplate J/gp47 family protein, partial [Methanothrix sp.]|nr:baseplate J/gp47 family protein [Methanothrix sp.]
MTADFTEFLDMTAEELYEDWLNYITTRDPLLQDTSVATFNSILAEAVASEFWIFLQLLKQKVKDSSVLTAEGEALSAIVLSTLPGGRQAGTRATGVILFFRPSAAQSDITIPAGIICAATSESGGLIEFQTIEAVVLEAGYAMAYVEASAIKAGTAGNVSTGAISIIRTPVVGITSCTNDAPFTGGTDQESDTDLRERALYTIWVNGRATIPLLEEHIDSIAGVREAHVETLGQGDALLVIDAEVNLINDIDEMVLENLAAGCTAPGVLGANIRSGANVFEIGDCSGAPVWVRNLQFTAVAVEVPFTYQEPNGTTQNGSVIIPAGSGVGATIQATLPSEYPNAVKVLGSMYAGTLSFDIFMGKGTYPRLWVAPELQAVDISLELVLTATPEVDLLDNIQASLQAKLASYKIG